MGTYFEKVKNYLLELEYDIKAENEEQQLFVVQKPDMGIVNMIIDCEDPILVFEQHLLELKSDDAATLKQLLQMNRTLVHGALVLDESGRNVIFRDTLQLPNLDLNEVEASLTSLSLFVSEYATTLLELSKK